MVFLKEILKKVYFEKNISRRQKGMQNFPFGRELRSCVWAFIFAAEEKLADNNLIDKCSVKSAAFFLVLPM